MKSTVHYPWGFLAGNSRACTDEIYASGGGQVCSIFSMGLYIILHCSISPTPIIGDINRQKLGKYSSCIGSRVQRQNGK